MKLRYILAVLLCTVAAEAVLGQVGLTPAPTAEPFPAPYGVPSAAHDRVVFASESGVEARSLDHAKLLWRHALTKNVPSRVFLSGSIVIVAEFNVYALNASSGKLLWRFSPQADTSLCIGTINEGVFYVGDQQENLYALRVADGRLIWRNALSAAHATRSRVAGVVADRDQLYVTTEVWDDLKGSESHSDLAKINAATGAIAWQIRSTAAPGEIKQSSWTQPALDPSGGVVVGDTSKNEVLKFSSQGDLVWRFAGVKAYLGPLVPPVVRDGVVYFEAGDRYFRQLRATDGLLLRQTLFVGSLTDFALCRKFAVVSRGGLEQVDLESGTRARQSLVSDDHLISAGLTQTADGLSIVALNSEGIYVMDCSESDDMQGSTPGAYFVPRRALEAAADAIAGN